MRYAIVTVVVLVSGCFAPRFCAPVSAQMAEPSTEFQTSRAPVAQRMDPKIVFTDQHEANLADAAARGDKVRVARLVAAGAAVNARGNRRITPLHWAIVHGSAAGIDALMAAGADAAAADEQDTTAIHLATAAGDASLLDALLAGGASANIRDPKLGRTPIFDAILADRDAQFLRLLPLTDLDLGDDFGTRPLHTAASVGDYPKILRLLEAGADPRAGDASGRTFQAYLPQEGAAPASASAKLLATRESVVAWLRKEAVTLEGGLVDEP